MVNEPPKKKPRQQVSLRIPSVSPLLTYLMLFCSGALVLSGIASVETAESLIATLGVNVIAVVNDAQFYRPFSALFLNANPQGPNPAINLAHAASTLYLLYIIGSSTERLWGHVRYALVFILGGMAGAVLSMSLSAPNVFLVAAANGVLAAGGAELVYLYKHRKLLGRNGRRRRNYLAALMAINLVLAFFAANVDLWGPLGGLIGGAVLGWAISPFHVVRMHPDEPGALLGEDVNPLARRAWVPLVYGAVLAGAFVAVVVIQSS